MTDTLAMDCHQTCYFSYPCGLIENKVLINECCQSAFLTVPLVVDYPVVEAHGNGILDSSFHERSSAV